MSCKWGLVFWQACILFLLAMFVSRETENHLCILAAGSVFMPGFYNSSCLSCVCVLCSETKKKQEEPCQITQDTASALLQAVLPIPKSLLSAQLQAGSHCPVRRCSEPALSYVSIYMLGIFLVQKVFHWKVRHLEKKSLGILLHIDFNLCHTQCHAPQQTRSDIHNEPALEYPVSLIIRDYIETFAESLSPLCVPHVPL